jgi:hypothetical protein
LFTSQAKEEVLDRLVKIFWIESKTKEDNDYSTPISEDLMIKMKKSSCILPDGHIKLPTLWKEGKPLTPSNYEYAKVRLFSLLGSKLMTCNETLLRDYEQVFLKWEKLGYIERVEDNNPTKRNMWY